MRYVVANKEKALDAGVLLLGHLVKGESIILNEKEVMCLPSLDGELEDRILLLDGIVYTNTSMNQIIVRRRLGIWQKIIVPKIASRLNVFVPMTA